MQVTAKVTWEGGWKLVRIHRVHICLNLDQIEFTLNNPYILGYLSYLEITWKYGSHQKYLRYSSGSEINWFR